MLGVDPAAPRGVARALMAESEAQARAAGKTLMTLNTTRRMKAAQAMYQRLGYERTEDTVFPDGFVLLGYMTPRPKLGRRPAATHETFPAPGGWEQSLHGGQGRTSDAAGLAG